MRNVNDVSELGIESGYWYVATPYSKYKGGLEAAYLAAHDVSADLHNAGVRNYTPIVYTHTLAHELGIDPRDHEFWMDADYPFMERAHGLIVAGMDGWDESDGVAYEIDMFTDAGKPIVFLDPLTFDYGVR